jgi:hypothetical protein
VDPHRSLPRSLCRAAAAIYLPLLAPFLVGPLRECSHCVETYLRAFPYLPGLLPATFLRRAVQARDDSLWLPILLATGLFALATALQRRPGPVAPISAAAIASAMLALGWITALALRA